MPPKKVKKQKGRRPPAKPAAASMKGKGSSSRPSKPPTAHTKKRGRTTVNTDSDSDDAPASPTTPTDDPPPPSTAKKQKVSPGTTTPEKEKAAKASTAKATTAAKASVAYMMEDIQTEKKFKFTKMDDDAPRSPRLAHNVGAHGVLEMDFIEPKQKQISGQVPIYFYFFDRNKFGPSPKSMAGFKGKGGGKGESMGGENPAMRGTVPMGNPTDAKPRKPPPMKKKVDASKYEYMDSAGTTMPTVRNAHMTTVEVPVFDARKVRSSVLAQGFELGFLERLDGSRCLDQVFKLTAVGSGGASSKAAPPPPPVDKKDDKKSTSMGKATTTTMGKTTKAAAPAMKGKNLSSYMKEAEKTPPPPGSPGGVVGRANEEGAARILQTLEVSPKMASFQDLENAISQVILPAAVRAAKTCLERNKLKVEAAVVFDRTLRFADAVLNQLPQFGVRVPTSQTHVDFTPLSGAVRLQKLVSGDLKVEQVWRNLEAGQGKRNVLAVAFERAQRSVATTKAGVSNANFILVKGDEERKDLLAEKFSLPLPKIEKEKKSDAEGESADDSEGDDGKGQMGDEDSSSEEGSASPKGSPKRKKSPAMKAAPPPVPAAKTRVIFLNAWCPLVEKVHGRPLACCDTRTASVKRDYFRQEMHFATRRGEIHVVRYDPKQKWYYYPDMKLGECILFRTWDSGEDKYRVAKEDLSTPHGAAWDGESELSEKMHPRRSVEIRMAFAVGF